MERLRELAARFARDERSGVHPGVILVLAPVAVIVILAIVFTESPLT